MKRWAVVFMAMLLSACVTVDGYSVLGTKINKKKKKKRSYKHSQRGSHKKHATAPSPAVSPGLFIYDSEAEGHQPIQKLEPENGNKP